MSTATKLEYLNDTKQLLKENINNLGGSLTNEPFRQYASVLEGIYESLPKVNGKGSNLSLSPTKVGKIKLNGLYGQTNQASQPSPSSPVPIESVTGNQNVTISNSDSSSSNTYEVNLGTIELNKIGDYEDSIKKSTGKNLFNINASDTNKGIEYNFDGSILSLNGTTTGGGNIYNNNTNTILLKSGTYNISTSASGAFTRNNLDVAIYIRKSDSSSILTLYSTANYIGNSSFTLTEDTEIYVQIYTNGSGFVFNNFNIYIMLNEGSTELPYEPYGKVWYVEKNIGKVVLDGSEDWNSWYNIGDNIGFYHGQSDGYGTPDELAINNLGKCNRFTEATLRTDIVNGLVEKYKLCGGGNMYIAIGLAKAKLSDYSTKALAISSFKNWLSSNNTQVDYVLKTPIYEVITNTELIEDLESLYNAKSKNGTTNINVDGSLPVILGVKALKGE